MSSHSFEKGWCLVIRAGCCVIYIYYDLVKVPFATFLATVLFYQTSGGAGASGVASFTHFRKRVVVDFPTESSYLSRQPSMTTRRLQLSLEAPHWLHRLNGVSTVLWKLRGTQTETDLMIMRFRSSKLLVRWRREASLFYVSFNIIRNQDWQLAAPLFTRLAQDVDELDAQGVPAWVTERNLNKLKRDTFTGSSSVL